MFTLVQLVTFRSLVQFGSFSRAARNLGISQPAVSQQIDALQKHFGVKLVDVAKGRVRLTEAGRFLAERGEQLFANIAAVERQMKEFASAETGILRVGATATIGRHGLAPLLLAFCKAHPGVDVQITIGNNEAMIRAVRDGSIALALIEGPATAADIDIFPYAYDELVLIVPRAGHRLSRRTTVRVKDLIGERFIMREVGSGTRELIEAALRRADVAPTSILELPTGDAIASAVEANLGISIVSRMVADRDSATGYGKLVRVQGIDLRRTFRMIRSRIWVPSPASEAFATIVHDRARSAGLTR